MKKDLINKPIFLKGLAITSLVALSAILFAPTTYSVARGSLPAPIGAFQTVSATLAAADVDTWTVDVQAGQDYTFTFCSNGGTAAFNTIMELRRGAISLATDDDTCGLQSEIIYSSPLTETLDLRVSGSGGAGGAYTLSYKQNFTNNIGSQQASFEVSGGEITILNTPDNFTFTPFFQTSDSVNLFNNTAAAGSDDTFQIRDTRGTGGFDVQLQAADFTDPGGAIIPNGNMQIVTTATVAPGNEINGVLHSTGAMGPDVSAPFDAGVSDLGDAATYTANGTDLDGAATMISGALGASGRIGDYSVDLSYYVSVPASKNFGNYGTTLIYTIIQ